MRSRAAACRQQRAGALDICLLRRSAGRSCLPTPFVSLQRGQLRSCGRTPVYVGQTARDAEERFEQHKSGYKASRWVRDFGLELVPIPDREYATQAAAIEAERTIADGLKADGRFCVYGGH